ncbi:hypothetical protein FIBSPDRAFT_175390, partial [Athelia psychrophila]
YVGLSWPQPGDVRSPYPALSTHANHVYLPRNGKRIFLPAFARALQAGYTLCPSSRGSSPLAHPPSSSSHPFRCSTSHGTTLSNTTRACARYHITRGRIRAAPDQRHARRGSHERREGKADDRASGREGAGPPRERVTSAEWAVRRDRARGDGHRAARTHHGVRPRRGHPPRVAAHVDPGRDVTGWAPSRTVGLVDAMPESGKIREAMTALVAAQILGDMKEVEAEHLLVEQEEASDGDEDETPEAGNSSLFSTHSVLPREVTPATSEEEGSEHEK